MFTPEFELESLPRAYILRLRSADGTNRLTRSSVLSLTKAIHELTLRPLPLIITGNEKFFSAGADLAEIAGLGGPGAYEFSQVGQRLMNAVAAYKAPVFAAVYGYCMGGGLDLALACRYRIASPHAIFGHRGAALGLITGWGGTQRLPRLIGKGRALQMFVAAEKVTAQSALQVGLIDEIANDPVAAALKQIQQYG